jgi:hypothetical protein
MATFTADTFADGAAGGTPITAAKLNNLETAMSTVFTGGLGDTYMLGVGADGPSLQKVTHTTAGNISLTFASNWGVNTQGNAYHDNVGAAAGEEAVALFDANGNLTVTKINH